VNKVAQTGNVKFYLPSDTHYSRGPHMQLWLFNRRNLQQVKCGRVEEIKGDEGDDPNYFMDTYFEGKLNR
jgi:hypothetical protein